MTATIEVRPWPTYSEHGEGPFWEVRLESARFVGWVAWATHLGRFVESNEMARLRKRNARLAYALDAFMVSFSQKPGHLSRDKKSPKRDTETGQGTGTSGTLSRAQESLRLETLLSRSGHNERDGTEDRDTDSRGTVSDGFAPRPVRQGFEQSGTARGCTGSRTSGGPA